MTVFSKDVLVERTCGITLHIHLVRSDGVIWAEAVDAATGKTACTISMHEDYYHREDLDGLDEAYRLLRLLPPKRLLGSTIISK